LAPELTIKVSAHKKPMTNQAAGEEVRYCFTDFMILPLMEFRLILSGTIVPAGREKSNRDSKARG
jgi:hypothetical protein